MTRAEFAAAIRAKYLENAELDTGQKFECYDALFHTGSKLIEYFGNHERISISVSGGSDSDCIVHLICNYFPEYLPKCNFVFVNTGLEYAATKRHIADLESKYGITIDRIRGLSVVTVVRKYGMPILSKYKSEIIRKYIAGQTHAEGYIFGDKIKTYKAMKFTDNQKELVHYLKDH